MNTATTTTEKEAGLFAKNLRKVVGWSYIVADSAYAGRCWVLAKGYEREMAQHAPESAEYTKLKKTRDGMYGEIKGMALWSAGGLVMGVFGNRTVEKETAALQNKLVTYLHDQGVEMGPEKLAIALKEKDKGLLSKIADFAYQYPSEIMHTCFALGAVDLIRSGSNSAKLGTLTKKGGGLSAWQNEEKKFGTLGMGIVVLAGALIGALVPEKSKEELAELEPAKGFGDKASRWVQGHANKATSALYFANNIFSSVGTMEDYRDYKKNWKGTAEQPAIFKNAYLLRGGALATYVFGAGVLQATSKSAGSKGEKVEHAKDDIFHEAAALLRAQPPAVQQQLIGQVSEYLSTRRELGFVQMKAPDIAAKLNEALQGITPPATAAQGEAASDWVSRTGEAATAAQSKSPGASPG